MQPVTRRRIALLSLCILALFVSCWFELFLQRNQSLVGAGISRPFLFLLINQHMVVVIILLYLIVRQSIKLFLERHKELPGSVFKRNLLFAFTLFSVIPSCFVFFTAGKFITTSIDDWFHARIGTGLQNGLILHQKQTFEIREKLEHLARKVVKRVKRDPGLLNGSGVFNGCDKTITSSCHSSERNISGNTTAQSCHPIEALRLSGDDAIYPCHPELVSGSTLNNVFTYVWNVDSFEREILTEVKIWRTYRKFNDRSMQSLRENFVKVLKQANPDGELFDFYGSLYFVQKIESAFVVVGCRYPESIRYPLIEIQNSIYDYEQLKSLRNPIYLIYVSMFLLVTLLILFLSIWCAFYMARGISTPIQQLLSATEKIGKGDWNVTVEYNKSSDLRSLAIAFNNMTKALRNAHYQLELKNEELKIVLENINAAVFLVSNNARIISFNAAAKNFVAQYLKIQSFKNKKVSSLGREVSDKFFELVRELRAENKTVLSKEISFKFEQETCLWMVHLTVIKLHNPEIGQEQNELLVVLEDLTNIVKANTIKTWQEAAKQVAHEIKNPLTPIQLATQRLQRKFEQNQLNDEKMFMDCTDTILSQVGVIKGLVAHFAEFASMPAPQIELTDLNTLIEEIVCLYQVSYNNINFEMDLQSDMMQAKTDVQRFKRIIVNLLDNSVRILLASDQKYKQVKIKTSLLALDKKVQILVSDNGPGVAQSVRDKLFLPYVSTEKKNMGLGLAIVHDSVIQLGGSIKLAPSSSGAVFEIILPV